MRLEDGDDVSAEEICRDNPDLYLAFLARMEELRAANLTLAVLAASASPPEIPGYRILNELGRGGSAVVYRAIQLEMDREVAVKVFFPQLQDKGFFDREIATVKRLTHECIPVVFECGSLSFGNSLLCWFSMELLSGGVVKKAKVCQKPTADILRLFKKIVEAVQYAHTNGVLHRDIKPANILLDDAGIPHVADFGIAKLIEDDQETSTISALRHMGTPAYTALELINGDRDQPDARSEIYSLGVLLFELLTGQHPFGKIPKSLTVLRNTLTTETAPPVSSLRTAVSIDLDTFVSKLLSSAPTDRYESCVIVLEELDRLLQNKPIVARRVSAAERAYRWCKTRYITTFASLAGTFVILVLLTQLLISDIQLRDYTLQLESRATQLASINHRLSSSVTSSRLHTVQSMLATDRSHALNLLEDEVAFPPDRRGFSWNLLQQQAAENVIELSGLGGGFERIQQLAFSASAEHLIVCSKPFDVSIVDLQTQQRMCVAEEMRIGSNVVFMPDQKRFLCQNQREEVLLVGLVDGQMTQRFMIDEPIRQKMAVTKDGQFLLGMTIRGSLVRLDLESGEYVKSPELSAEIPVAIWLTPDDQQVHVVRRDAAWEKWNVADLQLIEETDIGFTRTSSQANPAKIRFAAANFQTDFGLCIALAFDDGICIAH